MLDITVDGDDIRAGQRATSPFVYLDHWALLEFSENAMQGTRFVEALQARNGTLALSWLNLCEFSKITVAEQATKAECLLERILPQLFFIEIEPFRVIQRENELLAGGPRVPPHSDESFLRAFTYLRSADSTSLSLFTTHKLFQYTQNLETAQRFDHLADVLVDRIEAMREEVATDESFESIVRRLPQGPQIQAGTRYIIRELLRTMLLNQAMRITKNHSIDLLHAVVPLAYCDFVLLDSHWEEQVTQMRTRVSSTGLAFSIAKVFSMKSNGVDRFLTELEAGVRMPQT